MKAKFLSLATKGSGRGTTVNNTNKYSLSKVFGSRLQVNNSSVLFKTSKIPQYMFSSKSNSDNDDEEAKNNDLERKKEDLFDNNILLDKINNNEYPSTYEQFQEGFNQFISSNQEALSNKQSKNSGRQQGVKRILEIDMTKNRGFRAGKEYFIDPETNEQVEYKEAMRRNTKLNNQAFINRDSKTSEKQVKNDIEEEEVSKESDLSSTDSNNIISNKPGFDNNTDQNINIFRDDFIIGKNDKFPVHNYIPLGTTQFGKEINLHTYYYPAHYEKYKQTTDIEEIISDKVFKGEHNTQTNSHQVSKEQFKGVIILFHGLFCHSTQLAYAAKFYSNQGYDVHAFDYQGQGLSGGDRGLMESSQAMVNDCISYINQITAFYSTLDSTKSKPINYFTLGYSFGGLLSSLLNQRNFGLRENESSDSTSDSNNSRFLGQIIWAGAMTNRNINKRNTIQLKIIRTWFSSFLKWRVPVRVNFDGTGKSHIKKFLNSDPLVYKGFYKIGTGLAIDDLFKENKENGSLIKTPVFFIQGTEDKAVNPKDSKEYYEKYMSKEDSVFLLKEDLDHSISYDYRINQFLEDSEKWMSYLAEKERIHKK